jgi:hypothetical protein
MNADIINFQSNMTTIDIYDIGSATWHTQLASGVPGSRDGIPAPRYYGCSVMVSSPDNSSYNIYMYGGESKPGLPGSKFNDIWALLIPTFTWVKLSSTGLN